jgi:hypothetical protein
MTSWFRTAGSLLFLCLGLAGAGVCLEPSGSAAPLPDAPSAAAQAADADTRPAVARQKSIFFPDLATDRAPLRVSLKFGLFANNSISPAAIIGSAFGAGINQATNTPSGYGQGAEGYGKRFGSSMATRASTQFFGTFVIASVARQDPRYFGRGAGTVAQRLGHAVSRVVVAPNDGGGSGFNWGGVFGPLAGETMANTYLPVREQTGARTASRYALQLAVRAGTNVLREFWPDMFKGKAKK